MMWEARSCERPSKSSASVFLPSSVSNSYSFSTGTQGRSSRFLLISSFRRACSACPRAAPLPILTDSNPVLGHLIPPVALVRVPTRGGCMASSPWRARRQGYLATEVTPSAPASPARSGSHPRTVCRGEACLALGVRNDRRVALHRRDGEPE